jgi:SH3-like domain-containing protein
MRSLGIIALVVAFGLNALALTADSFAAEKFPYTAYTNSTDVYIRSGPGKNYYPTEKLGKGEAVEIYRHDPGGWYAIRPPEGSFCWVPADTLKPHGDRMATVVKDKSPCYVGTKFSSARDVSQVRLDKGEEVEILDIKQLGDGPDAQSWCEIAPPSGEFRWVFGKFVDRDAPTGVTHKDDDRRSSKHDEFDDRDRSNPPRRSRDADDHTAQQSSWTIKTAAASSSGAAKNEGPRSEERGASDPGPAPSSDPFQAELSSIDYELSKMISDDPVNWEFTGLRRRAEPLLGRADTALERGKVRLLLNRIARMEDVKRRNELLGQPGNASAIAAERPSVLPVATPNRYDGIGKLTPVVSQRPNAPQYALIDESNQIVSFISAAPGMNLQPYVGKEVGVSGQRGFMPELKKPHVTAQRVNLIDGTTIR